jgi:hypothetical protein
MLNFFYNLELRQNWSEIRYRYFLGNVNFHEHDLDPKIKSPPTPETQIYFGLDPKIFWI